MERKVLLVIDMLRDFVEPDGALTCGPAAEEITPFVISKVKEFQANGHTVIFVNDSHLPDDIEFNRFPPHCIKNSPGARLIGELEELQKSTPNCHNLVKNRYSGFYGTGLEEILTRQNPSEVHVTGVCTNICVLYTVEELCNRDYNTFVYKNGVASFDVDGHNWALKQMQDILGATIL